ncbi:NACHT, LRR and PYD domains-containing protein 9-like [Xyrauchen texanus]|uniref:NACHT, LRR and PYD domains-containing protein 9-like n=1 Tax=Xyrauchen texanus TaxID=154827 RepID=UPI0022428D39|nr:NACHT, LRR and PYD domains-containing protein 9-like [Xyrauchen texanus]
MKSDASMTAPVTFSGKSEPDNPRLSGCMVTQDYCSYLASALNSNPLHLKELDLSYNHHGDTGVTLLSARLQDPNCKLEKHKCL